MGYYHKWIAATSVGYLTRWIGYTGETCIDIWLGDASLTNTLLLLANACSPTFLIMIQWTALNSSYVTMPSH